MSKQMSVKEYAREYIPIAKRLKFFKRVAGWDRGRGSLDSFYPLGVLDQLRDEVVNG